MIALVARKYYIDLDTPMIIDARQIRVDTARLNASSKAHISKRSRSIGLLPSRSPALPQKLLHARQISVAESRRGFETGVMYPLGTRLIRIMVFTNTTVDEAFGLSSDSPVYKNKSRSKS